MERLKSLGLSRRAIVRIIIAIYCVIIGSIVATVMFSFYDPSQNNLRALCSVCLDIICIIILIIMISGFVFDNFGLYRTTRLFAGMLVASIWALFMDFLNWAFDGSLEFGHLTFWFTVCSLCMGAVLAAVLSIYLYCYMEETHGLSKMKLSALCCAVLNLFSFGLTFVLALSGTAFNFVDGHYETGILYDVVAFIPIASVLYLTIYVLCNVKAVGGHDAFAVSGYVLFMIAGALIEAVYSIGTTYVAVALADLFIFVMLQNEIITNEKQNVRKWMKKSNTDVLTGFFNRRAYETDMVVFEKEKLADNFVYVSADVNSLKEVNDTYGHGAGDELLVGAAKCLKTCFGPYGKVYRIGGDEFVAIIFAEGELLDVIRKDVEEVTQNWRGKLVPKLTISCGYVTKGEAENLTVKQIAALADKRMYEAKDRYYRDNGIERRKSLKL